MIGAKFWAMKLQHVPLRSAARSIPPDGGGLAPLLSSPAAASADEASG